MKFLVDLGLVNFPIKFDRKFVFTLEQNLSRFFDSLKKVAAVSYDSDAQIIFHAALYTHYQELKLTDNFRKYLEALLLSKHVLRRK